MRNEYTDDIEEGDIEALINAANKADSDNARLTSALSSLGVERREENFLHHQINTAEMLEKLEHFYRGDYASDDGKGNIVWQKQSNKDLVTFNDFGVTSLMEILSKYIDKNTILSEYSEERIYQIIGDIGDDLILFILCNYESMGMDTYFKKTKFRMIITTTTHIIESTYRRAIHGKTLDEVNQSKVVGQFGSPLPPNQQGRPKKENFLTRLIG